MTQEMLDRLRQIERSTSKCDNRLEQVNSWLSAIVILIGLSIGGAIMAVCWVLAYG